MGTPKVQLFDLSIFDDGVELLAQLEAGKYDEAVHNPLMGKFIHMDALQAYFKATDVESRLPWARCLRYLISINAPTDIGDTSAAEVFSSGSWEPTSELTAELARQYLASGLIDPKRPMPGKLLTPAEYAETHSDGGRLPMSSAISWENADYVRVLIESGVSWKVGPVVEGGPDREALEYAESRKVGSVVAVLTEHLMRERLKAPGSGGFPGAAQDVGARRRPKLGI